MKTRLLAVILALAAGGGTARALPDVPIAELELAAHPSWTGLARPNDPVGVNLRLALATSSRYAMTTWWATYMSGLEPYSTWGGRLTAKGTLDSEEVRRYSCVAYGLAAALVTGAYDPGLAGVDTETARRRVVEIVDLLVRTHRANVGTGAGWGGSWQSAMWAGEAGTAGWMVEPLLPSATRTQLARMLAYEADAVTARKQHYLRDRSGRVLVSGDSGAEELAWDAFGAMTAVELLPRHPNRTAWATAAYSRFVGAYARPADVGSRTLVNGRPFGEWVGGSNVEPDGFVVNHGGVNPDYTTDLSLWAAPVSALTGQGVPEAVLTNADVLYRALTTVRFTAPPYRSPGGTVYTPGGLYYPAGVSWGRNREVVYSGVDVQMAALSRDPAVRKSAAKWALVHLDRTRRMQARFTTGQIYGPVTEDRYQAREEYAIKLLGTAALTWWLGHNRWLSVDTSGVATKGSL